jgi:4a-hydroxytetrahydrobiopterin dehydratase
MATIKEEQIRALPGWQARGDGISRTLRFDDFGVATRFVGRIALDAAVACREPLIGIRGGRVTVTFVGRDGATPTRDDVAVARRIQRLLGDHRHPVGRAGPWSPLGRLTGTRGQWGRPARKAQLRHLPAWRRARDSHAGPHQLIRCTREPA